MQRWSFSVGRVFGVQVRMHLFFVLLLMLSMMWAGSLGRPLSRGLALWLMVVAAVAVRETARGLGAAWFGLGVKSLLLLPTGGIVQYDSAAGMARAGERRTQRVMALIGPVTSLAFGLTVAGIVLTVAPQVDLLGRSWVSPEHLLRALVWVNLLLGAVNLLPAWPLDGGRVLKGEMMRGVGTGKGGAKSSAEGLRTFAMASPMVAIALVLVGMVTVNFWLMMAGLAIFLAAQLEGQGVALSTGADLVKVREVMLTEYSILSASATLEDAVEQSRHTLQDVFPVVRAGNMVGAVSRQEVLAALAASGNGYVQGIMTKALTSAGPEDSLVDTLERVTGRTAEEAGASSELVAVLEGDRVLGILTPGNLRRSVGLLALRARASRPGSRADETD